MDLISHGLLGFVLGHGLKLERNYVIILMIACVAPDIDSLSLVAGWDTYSIVHRGPVHSFFCAVVISLVIVVAARVIHLPGTKSGSLFFVCLGGTFSHLLLDILTPWETAVFWPFWSEKITYDLTFFFDPVFFAVVCAASLMCVKYVKREQVIMGIVCGLLVLNCGVRYYEKEVACTTVEEMCPDCTVLPLPTLRPDRWWVAVITETDSGYIYDIHSVDSIHRRLLTTVTVASPFMNYCGPAELPIDSPQKAVAHSKKDKKVSAFIDRSRLPAVRVIRADSGWSVFWYDAFSELHGGFTQGMTVCVDVDGTCTVGYSSYMD
jgi:membrane-bound metal-dependent hydrolase YbcI (DUF457 family)